MDGLRKTKRNIAQDKYFPTSDSKTPEDKAVRFKTLCIQDRITFKIKIMLVLMFGVFHSLFNFATFRKNPFWGKGWQMLGLTRVLVGENGWTTN
jgi:hypothetical protein